MSPSCRAWVVFLPTSFQNARAVFRSEFTSRFLDRSSRTLIQLEQFASIVNVVAQTFWRSYRCHSKTVTKTQMKTIQFYQIKHWSFVINTNSTLSSNISCYGTFITHVSRIVQHQPPQVLKPKHVYKKTNKHIFKDIQTYPICPIYPIWMKIPSGRRPGAAQARP